MRWIDMGDKIVAFGKVKYRITKVAYPSESYYLIKHGLELSRAKTQKEAIQFCEQYERELTDEPQV